MSEALTLGSLGTVPQVFAAGTFVQQQGDPRVFVVDNTGALRLVPDPYTFTAMGGNWQAVVTIPSVDPYPKGSELPSIPQPTAAQTAAATAAAAPATSSFGWFTDPTQEIISGIPNIAIVGGAALVLLLLMKKK